MQSGSGDGPHTRTVVFTDIVGSSPLLERAGDGRWGEMLTELDELMLSLAQAAGGRVVKSLGDGHMLAFPEPKQAVSFSAALQRRMDGLELLELPILLRIGMHHGDVIERDGDLHGRTVHVASRIGAIAEAAQVLCSSEIRDALSQDRDFAFSSPRTVALRGIDGLHDVAELVWDVGGGRNSGGIAGPMLLDRGRERDRIDTLLHRGLTRLGGAGFLEAPPGIGKSALLRLAAERAVAAGLTVLQARGDELEMDYPFGLVTQLFDDVVLAEDEELFVGEARFAAPLLTQGKMIVGGTDGTRERRALLAVCRRLALRHPLALIVDDAHWADVSSLQWLAQLVRRVDGEPLVVLVSARPSQPAERGQLLSRMRSEPGVDRLELRPLSVTGTAALVERELGPAAEEFVISCHAASGGNPFLLGELLRSLRDDGVDPRGDGAEDILLRHRAGLTRVVLARLAALGPQVIALAEAAATLPADSPLRQATKLANLDPRTAGEAADALTVAGVLTSARPLRFVHPLTRRAIYDEIAPTRRSRLHRAALAMLLSDDAPVQDAASHAMLVDPADDPVVVHSLILAAERATKLGTPESAARYLRRALEEPPASEVRDAVRVRLGEAELGLLNYAAAIEVLLPVLDTSQDAALRLRAVRAITSCYGYGLHSWEEAAAVAEAELQRSKDPTSDDHLWVEATAIYYRNWSRDGADLLDDLAAAVARIREPGPGAALILERYAAELLAKAAEPAETIVEFARRAYEYAPLEVDEGLLILAQCGRTDLAIPLLRQQLQSQIDQGNRRTTAAFHRDLADAYVLSGDLPAAEEHFCRADAIVAGKNAWTTLGCAWVRLQRGDPARARDLLADRGLLGEPEEAAITLGNLFALTHLWKLRGLLAMLDGDLETAEREMRRAERDLRWAPAPNDLRLCDVLLRQGRREEALLAADELVTPARSLNIPSELGLALALRARCLSSADEAVQSLERDALTLLARGSGRLAEAEGVLIYGESLRRAGRVREARPVLARARALALKCDAQLLASRAAEEQALAGARPRRDAVDGADALTASERRVAELAAQGRSNAEIAGQLVLSVRTIEMHLGRAYRKLGIEGRSALTEALTR